MTRTLCPSCLRDVPADWPHSCFRACRTCGTAIDPHEDYCWSHKTGGDRDE